MGGRLIIMIIMTRGGKQHIVLLAGWPQRACPSQASSAAIQRLATAKLSAFAILLWLAVPKLFHESRECLSLRITLVLPLESLPLRVDGLAN